MSRHRRCWTVDGKKTYDPVYFRWRNMMSRCYRPSAKEYSRYGGRGIEVCTEWHDYDRFYDDWLKLPGDGDRLDRRDNDGPYSPENCRRSAHVDNVRNTHRRKEITWQGRTKHYIDWAVELNMKPETLRSRVFRKRWPLERAMTEGVNRGC